MELTALIGTRRYAVNLKNPHDLSIPVSFEGSGLSAFGAPLPTRHAFAAEGFIGDVAQGGSCNCDVLQFIPHTSGTHTESIGHILSSPMPIPAMLEDSLIPATLITVTPVNQPAEHYMPALAPEDKVITRAALESVLSLKNNEFHEALIIRTLPNSIQKQTMDYSQNPPPFFSTEAMEFILSLGVRHLLVDLPSIDRLQDEGRLSNHHRFWERVREDAPAPCPKTITELIYVADRIADGQYILNLQLAPLMVDAAPSRPLLYRITPL